MTIHKSFVYKNTVIKFNIPKSTGNVGNKISKGRFYEQKFLEYIRSLKINGTYIDIGANIGNHSIFFAKFTDANKIISFEASKAIYKILLENIKLNSSADRIVPRNVAVGPKKGRVSLRVNEKDEIGGGEVIEGDDIIQVPLDEYVNENITIIKMDVEGYEFEVLQGMKGILNKHKPELFIEASTKDYFSKINQYLTGYGYKMVTVFNNTATYHFSTKHHGKTTNLYKYRLVRRLFRSS